jgi:hypothetical protein
MACIATCLSTRGSYCIAPIDEDLSLGVRNNGRLFCAHVPRREPLKSRNKHLIRCSFFLRIASSRVFGQIVATN